MGKEEKIIILGAGLTGLTIAYKLKQKGFRPIVIEKESEPGGVIKTYKKDGFVYEAGPNTGTLSSVEAAELFEELGNELKISRANKDARKRLIMKNGKWYPLPSGIISGIITPLFSTKDKFGILLEPLKKTGNNVNETVSNLVKRRLGKSFLDYAVDPFISGIYAGDAKKLVTAYALPKLYNLEQNYGSFIKGSIKIARNKTLREKKANKEIFSFDGGLSNLTDTLFKKTGKNAFIFNCKNLSIEYNGEHFTCIIEKSNNKKRIESKKIISTIPGYNYEKAFPFIEKKLICSFNKLEYAPVAQIILGYKKWEGSDINAFGGLIPGKENKNILGILFPSSIFPKRAPKSGALLSVFVGGIKQPFLLNKTDEDLYNLVTKEISKSLNQKPLPDLKQIYRYTHAIPQYYTDTKERLFASEEIQKKYPGFIIAGNVKDGIGMSDRIKQAVNIANEIRI